MSRVKVNLPDKIEQEIAKVQTAFRLDTGRHPSKEKAILAILAIWPAYIPALEVVKQAKYFLYGENNQLHEAETTE